MAHNEKASLEEDVEASRRMLRCSKGKVAQGGTQAQAQAQALPEQKSRQVKCGNARPLVGGCAGDAVAKRSDGLGGEGGRVEVGIRGRMNMALCRATRPRVELQCLACSHCPFLNRQGQSVAANKRDPAGKSTKNQIVTAVLRVPHAPPPSEARFSLF